MTVKITPSWHAATAAGALAYAQVELYGRHPSEVRLIIAPARRASGAETVITAPLAATSRTWARSYRGSGSQQLIAEDDR